MNPRPTLLATLLALGCNNGSADDKAEETDTTETDAVDSDTDAIDTDLPGVTTLDPTLFDIHTLVAAFDTTPCTLSDGSSSTCHRVVVRNEPAAWGPGCPSTYEEVGGVGFYDPDGTPILYALDAELWDLMEADGFDMVDEEGNVNVTVPTGPPGGGGPPAGLLGGLPAQGSSCLDAALEDELELTYLIPVTPAFAATNTTVAVPGLPYSGISLDGLPFAPPPPATVNGARAALPALDPCGGHPEPDGPFHWHLAPHEANSVLAANGIREDVRCGNVTQSANTIIGYAADGFAIYGSQDPDGTEPTDLDVCNGHDEGGYHYHVSGTEAPNTLSCLRGLTAQTFLDRN
jgi:hypothetical protein